jgi:hypothetical protein
MPIRNEDDRQRAVGILKDKLFNTEEQGFALLESVKRYDAEKAQFELSTGQVKDYVDPEEQSPLMGFTGKEEDKGIIKRGIEAATDAGDAGLQAGATDSFLSLSPTQQARSLETIPGYTPEEWSRMDDDLRTAALMEYTGSLNKALVDSAEVDRRNLRPVEDTVMNTPGMMGAPGIVHRVRHDEENNARARGIETRKSAVGGNTVMLLNTVSPPKITETVGDQEPDPKEVEAGFTYRKRMAAALSEAMYRDTGQRVGVAYDEPSNEWVYLDPDTSRWTKILADGVNTEDFSALVADPVQGGLLVGEIIISAGLAAYTGGVSLIASEGTLGAAFAAASKFVENKRAQALGFDQDSAEGVGTAAALGGVGGVAGGSLAIAGGKQAAKVGAKELAEGGTLPGGKAAAKESAKQLKEDVLSASEQRISLKEEGLNRAKAQARQAEIEEKLNDVNKNVVPDGTEPLVAPRATAGTDAPGSAEEERMFRGAMQDTLEKIGKRSDDEAAGLNVANTTIKGVRKTLSEEADKATKVIAEQEKILNDTAKQSTRDTLNKVTGRDPTKGARGENEIELSLNLPTATKVQTADRILDTAQKAGGTPQVQRGALYRMQQALVALRHTAGENPMLNGSYVEQIVETLDKTMKEALAADVDQNIMRAVREVRKDLVDQYRREVRSKFGGDGASAVDDWARMSGVQANERPGIDFPFSTRMLQALAQVFDNKRMQSLMIGQAKSRQRIKVLMEGKESIDKILAEGSDLSLSPDELLGMILTPSAYRKLAPKERVLYDRVVAAAKEMDSKFLDETREGVRQVVAQEVRVAMKESPSKAAGLLTEMLEGNPVLKAIMGEEYVESLKSLRMVIRKYTLGDSGVPATIEVKANGASLPRRALGWATSGAGLIAIMKGMTDAAATGGVDLVATGGASLVMMLGRGISRGSRQPLTDSAATRALARVMSRPDFLDIMQGVRATRKNMARTGVLIGELAEELGYPVPDIIEMDIDGRRVRFPTTLDPATVKEAENKISGKVVEDE